MKKLFFALFVCMLIMNHLVACSHGVSQGGEAVENADRDALARLKASLKSIDAACPVKADIATTLKGVRLKGRVVVYEYVIDEALLPGKRIKEVFDEQAEKKLRIALLSSIEKPEVRVFIKTVEDAGCTIEHRYKGNRSGEGFKFCLTPQDYFDYYDGVVGGEVGEYVDDKSYSRESLTEELQKIKPQLPMSMGLGLSLVDVKLTDRYVVYCIVMDEDKLGEKTVADLDNEESVAMMRERVVRGLNPVAKATMLKAMRDTGISYMYQYKGSRSRHVMKMVISVDDLQ